MAPAVELATGYITLAAESSGISKSIGKAFASGDRVAAKAGKTMGDAMSRAFDGSKPDIDNVRASIEQAQAKIAASSERNARAQEAAQRKVEIATAKAAEATAKYGEKSSQALSAVDRLATAQQKLEATTMAARAEQEKLQRELADSRDSLREMEAAAEKAADGTKGAFAGIGASIKSAMSGDFKTAFSGLRGDARTAANGVEAEFEEAGDGAADGFSKAFTAGLTGIVGLVGGLGIGVSISDGILSGIDRESFGDKLSAQMALSEFDSAKAGQVAGSLYSNAYGESLEEVYGALDSVTSSIPGMLDAPIEELERTTAQALDIASAYGVDVAEVATTAGVLVTNGLAKDSNEAMDLIVAGMTKMPTSVREEVFPVFQEYSKHFADLGIDGDQAMAMIVAGSANGAIGMDKMGDAVKEFQIRSTDMSKTTGDAYATLGLDMTEMTNQILAGGDSASEATSKIIQGILGIEDPAEQASTAIALFGTPLEDLSVNEIPGFLAAMDPMAGGLTDVEGSAKQLGDTLNDNTSTAFETFKRTVIEGGFETLKTVTAPAVQALTDAFTWLLDAVKPVGQWVEDNWEDLEPFAKGIGLVTTAVLGWTIASKILTSALWGQAVAFVAANAPMAAVVFGIGLLVGAVIWAYENVEWFRDVVDGAWAFIKDVTAKLVTWWTETAWPAIADALAWIGDKFVWLYENVIKPVWDAITDEVGAFITWFTETAWPWIKGAVESIGDVFSWLYDNIIKPVWDAIKVIIAVVVGTVITIFKGLEWIIKNVLGPIFSWLWREIVEPVFRWIGDKIKSFYRWFSETLVPALRSAIQWAADKFTWLYENVIKPVWTWITDKISAAWRFIRDNIFTPLKDSIRAVGDVFLSLYNRYVKPAFDWISSKVTGVWNWVRDNALRPLMDWIGKRVPDAFSGARKAIGEQWGKLKGLVSAPVEFFVDTIYNNGLRKNVNMVMDKVGLDQDKHLPFMNYAGAGRFASTGGGFRVGGYTGHGNPWEVAGAVHRDEHVIKSPSRKSIEAVAPGFLDDLNARGAAALGGAAAGGPGGPGTYLWGPLQDSIYASGVAHVQGSAPGFDLRAAANAWNQMSNIKVRYGSGPNQINVGAGAPAGTWGYAWTNGQIQLNPNIPANMKVGTAAHEIGHVLGLDHAGTNSIMHPMMRGPLWPSGYDRATMQRIYGGSGNGTNPSGGGFSIGDIFSSSIGAVTSFVKGIPGMFSGAFSGGNMITDMLGPVSKTLGSGAIDYVKDLIGLGGIMPKLFDGGGVIGKGTHLIEHQRNSPDYALPADLVRNLNAVGAERGRADGVTVIVQEREGMDSSQLGRRVGEAAAFEFTKAGL